MNDLDQALALQAPAKSAEDNSRHELPPLNVDGIPTPVDKMTQVQLYSLESLMCYQRTSVFVC